MATAVNQKKITKPVNPGKVDTPVKVQVKKENINPEFKRQKRVIFPDSDEEYEWKREMVEDVEPEDFNRFLLHERSADILLSSITPYAMYQKEMLSLKQNRVARAQLALPAAKESATSAHTDQSHSPMPSPLCGSSVSQAPTQRLSIPLASVNHRPSNSTGVLINSSNRTRGPNIFHSKIKKDIQDFGP